MQSTQQPSSETITNRDLMEKLEKIEKETKRGFVLASSFVLVTLSIGIVGLTDSRVEGTMAVVYTLVAAGVGIISMYLLNRAGKM